MADKPVVGDLAQAVNMHGDFILQEALRIEDFFLHNGERWVKFEGQHAGIPYSQVVWP